MKHSAKIYAKALADSLADRKADDKKITVNFLALLKKNQDLKKAREIIMLAEKILLKKNSNKKIILETARKTDARNVINAFAKKGDIIEEKINPALIAGLKIVVDQDKQLDFSLLNKLNNIF